MKPVLIVLGVIVGAVLLFALVVGGWAIGVNNSLVAQQEGVHAAWGQVEVVLQRRFDLIPNLVNTVKGYAKHEKDVLEEVTRLRSQWGDAKTPEEKVKTAGQLETSLGRLMVIVEKYPDLKANQNFRDLQFELSGTENRIAVERGRYNDVARGYNTAVRQFPSSFIAGLRGFKPAVYFETSPGAKESPKVDFGG